MLKKIKEDYNWKKTVSIIILVLLGAFVFSQMGTMMTPVSYFNGKEAIGESKDAFEFYKIDHDIKIEQEFIAKEKLINNLSLKFQSPKYFDTKGKITIELVDGNKKVIGKTELDSANTKNNSRVRFFFTEDSNEMNAERITHTKNRNEGTEAGGIELEPGKKYSLILRTSGISAADEMGIKMTTDASEQGSRLFIDNKEVENSAFFGRITYYRFSSSTLIKFLAILLVALILVLVPWRLLSEKVKVDEWLQRVLAVMAPFVIYWISMCISDKPFSEMPAELLTPVGPLNMLLLITLCLAIYTVTNRLKIANILSVLIGYIFAIACYFLIMFRDSPLKASDFGDIATGMDVASNYELAFNTRFIWITVIAFSFIALSFSLRQHKGLKLRYRVVPLILTVAFSYGLGNFIATHTSYKDYNIKVNAFNPAKSYRWLGYPLGFAISFKDLFIEKPENYSVEKAKEIASAYTSDKGAKSSEVSEKKPNVIAIMNEAFADLSYMGEVKTNQPYMPFFNSLTENAVKGRMGVSIFGGGTANSEFEFLTGNTMAFLGNKTAYTSLINDPMPSLATTLKDQGYIGNIAFHPGRYDNYKRNKVYPLLGFDKYIALEDLKSPKTLRAFVSDQGDYETIVEEYENARKKDKKSPFFLFNVTIQNHSGFFNSTGLVEAGITIEDPDLKMEQLKQYLNLVKESDNAFEYLVNYYSNIDEPTVIVMFGDHQPRVEGRFYEIMNERKGGASKFEVPFIIWANYDIEEEQDVQISSNLLAPYMLNKVGLSRTGYDKYLLDLHKKYPMVTRAILKDAKGNTSVTDTENLSKDLKEYQILQYNDMKNSKDRMDDFFYLKK